MHTYTTPEIIQTETAHLTKDQGARVLLDTQNREVCAGLIQCKRTPHWLQYTFTKEDTIQSGHKMKAQGPNNAAMYFYTACKNKAQGF